MASGITSSQIVTAEETLEIKHNKELMLLANAIIEAHGFLGTKYFDLCNYIRTHQIAPRQVSELLYKMSFTKSRISEINKVANAPDKVWNEYSAKLIGFTKALATTRTTLAIAFQMNEPQANEAANVIEDTLPNPTKDDETPHEKPSLKKRLDRIINLFAQILAKAKVKNRKWNVGTLIITVTTTKKDDHDPR